MKKMIQRLTKFLAAFLAFGLIAACSETKNDKLENGKFSFTMYKNEGCMCCTKWAEYMEEAGYEVTEKPVENLYALKFSNKVPNDMGSCHTAIIDGYVIEGHVPVEDIDRLLKERPDAKGIAVPGMPTGSPGMENPTRPDDEYDVFLFQEDGSRTVWASH